MKEKFLDVHIIISWDTLDQRFIFLNEKFKADPEDTKVSVSQIFGIPEAEENNKDEGVTDTEDVAVRFTQGVVGSGPCSEGSVSGCDVEELLLPGVSGVASQQTRGSLHVGMRTNPVGSRR